MRQIWISVCLAGPLSGLAAAGVPEGAVALNTSEIERLFSDALDLAEVQDEEGTRATNHWYSDGTFTVEWGNELASGEVRGKWWAENDQRCIIIETGVEGREGQVSCSPVFRLGDVILSVEPDGRIHGLHTVTPLPASQ